MIVFQKKGQSSNSETSLRNGKKWKLPDEEVSLMIIKMIAKILDRL